MQIAHSEFQDQLVRGLTHRMNNILTLFHGYIGLILDDKKLDQATATGLRKIKEGASAASELMDRTHALARPSKLVSRELVLADFLGMLKPSFDSLCGPKNRVELEVADDLPPIWADAMRVKTAIVEVVRNAIHATEEGGGLVKLSLRLAPVPAGLASSTPPNVLLSVIDTGAGIPKVTGEKIFQPFFSTKKKQQAVGLGLTVAQEYMKQVGGSLHFTSVPGRTEFQLLFPTRF